MSKILEQIREETETELTDERLIEIALNLLLANSEVLDEIGE